MSDSVAPHNHDDDVDGCLCDIELNALEVTADADLPPSSGGMRLTEAPAGTDDEDSCGCEITETTADEDLPVAVGGVA